MSRPTTRAHARTLRNSTPPKPTEHALPISPPTTQSEASRSNSESGDEHDITIREIEEIIGTNPIVPREQTMANPQNVNITLKDALKVVPEFDGESSSLTQFLEGLEEAKPNQQKAI